MSGPENGDPLERVSEGVNGSGGPAPGLDTGLYDDLADAPPPLEAPADQMAPTAADDLTLAGPTQGSDETRKERKARRTEAKAAHKEEARRAKRPRAVGALLRHPLSLSVVIIGALLGFVMTFAYVGAFADPTGELHDLPMGLVVLDQPQEVAGQRIAVGEQLVAALNKPQDPPLPVAFHSYATRADAVAALQRNEIVGAIVVPDDLSRTIGAIGTAAASGTAVPKAGQIEVIVNDGSGSLQPAVAERVGLAAASEVSSAVATQLASTLEGLDVSVPPADVASVSNPVSASFSRVPALDGKTGRGLPPFYTALMVTLAGLIGMTAIHVCVGTLLGRDHLELFGRILRFKRILADPLQRWKSELLLAVPFSALAGAAITWMAVWIVGAHNDQPWHTMLFAMLGVFAMSALSLLFLTAFGVAGDLLVLLITTIFGVPSARGVYPWEALPAFFRLLGEVLPLRYLTDGMRALFFFDGLADAGLRRGIIAVSIWAVASVVVGYFVALVCRRRALAAGEVVAPVASAA